MPICYTKRNLANIKMSFHFPETISQIHELALAHEKAVVIKSLRWDLAKEVSLICGKPNALWDNGAVLLMIQFQNLVNEKNTTATEFIEEIKLP